MVHKRTSVAIGLVVLMSAFYVALTILPGNVMGNTLYVGGSGPGNYTTIQSAVNGANTGDTVFVYSGTYVEDVSIPKSLILTGENRDTTVIRGTGTADTVLITTDGVTVSGFTMENSGSVADEAGIRLFFVQNCHVEDNVMSGNSNGLTLRSSHSNTITGNVLSLNGNGIYLWQSNLNRVENNTLSNNTAGIVMEEINNSTVEGNTLLDNGFAIRIMDSEYLTLVDNVMTGNGIFLTGSSLAEWNTHVIDLSNAVNGKPVQYWKNMTGGAIPADTGEVILANCQGVTIDYQNVSNGSVGIDVGYSSKLAITNNTVLSNYHDGIYLYHSENNTILGNTFSNNGHDGLSLHYSYTNDIVNNVASGNLGSGISLYDSGGNSIVSNDISQNGDEGFYLEYSDRNFVTGNKVTSNTVYGGYMYYSDVNKVDNNNLSHTFFGLSLRGANSNSIENNTAFDIIRGFDLFSSSHNLISDNIAVCDWEGFYLSLSNDNTMVNNYASSSNKTYPMGSITLWFSVSNSLSDNVMVENGLVVSGDFLEQWNTHMVDTSNLVNGRSVRYWNNVTGGTVPQDAGEVILANCANVIVEDQNLSGGSYGMEMGFSTGNLVANSTFADSRVGAYAWNSDGNTFLGNEIAGNDEGLILHYSDFNDVNGNWVSLNKEGGIRLYNSDNNTIGSNDLWTNGYGIFLSDSDDNTVLLNNAVSNGYGIYLSASFINVLYGNNIIDNAYQGRDNRDSSQWDNGYPMGGNFWSDYTGIDVMSGPNQDIPGLDGIGDTPYVIDADSEDRYPLMIPPMPLPPSAPMNLSASAGDQEISLSWNPPSFDGGLPISNYRIYRGTTPGGEVFLVGVGNVLTHLDMGLTNGQLYCYRVSAVNGVGEGPLSNEACATPTATPGAPVISQADLSGNGFENVTIKWSPSSDDGAGQKSVIGYEVYRGTTYDSSGMGYQLLAVVPNGTIEYDDNMTGEGNPNNYFYQICAVDLNDLRNCSTNQAGKYTRILLTGTNLVSNPLIQSDENVEKDLQTVKWDKAWTFDSFNEDWVWHMMFKPYRGELYTINITQGLWVNVTEFSNLTVAGVVPLSTEILLRSGWNLVGFPSIRSDVTVGDLKLSTGATRVEGYDSMSGPYHLREMGDSETFEAGYGYWIWADSEATWIVDFS